MTSGAPVVFGELPKTSTGKIQKFVLRERIATGELVAAPFERPRRD